MTASQCRTCRARLNSAPGPQCPPTLKIYLKTTFLVCFLQSSYHRLNQPHKSDMVLGKGLVSHQAGPRSSSFIKTMQLKKILLIGSNLAAHISRQGCIRQKQDQCIMRNLTHSVFLSALCMLLESCQELTDALC